GTWEKRRINKKLAEKVMKIAENQGYNLNAQASLLRRDKSNIVGMIVPKYDNRYFGEIAEQFEAMARSKGMFPVVTCTQRDPELEFEAAKELVGYQVECLISTGATDPDRIAAFCKAAGVQALNLDLPGKDAPSVISDNYAGARDLTSLILRRCRSDLGWEGPLRFIGGRLSDHNTAARLDGFMDAHKELGLKVPNENIQASGYSAKAAWDSLKDFRPFGPTGIFVNSTISLEGVVRWHSQLSEGTENIRFGCFDRDPFGKFLPGNVGMVEQDVLQMLEVLFELVGQPNLENKVTLIPCNLEEF
ncbi:MAG: substrate-binding domain-containing protein, partial [Alphaproteobacteria bacterium]|nr:substrate-binding domain-containing protein [Alphaproteobacteria bacterium]